MKRLICIDETAIFKPFRIGDNLSSANNLSNQLVAAKEYMILLLAAFLIYLLFNVFFERIRVQNISMQPTLYANELILVNKFAYKNGEFEIGDIIVFSRPEDNSKNFVKRVIGLPGDEILMQNGILYVNGRSFDEPYVVTPAFYNGYWQVAQDELFVLGDNRNISIDSHNWANGSGVLIKDIVGKVVFLYWPLNKVEIIR